MIQIALIRGRAAAAAARSALRRIARRALPASAAALVAGAALAAGIAEQAPPAAPDPAWAAELFGAAGPAQVMREDGPVPGWRVSAQGRVLGHVASTWEVAGSVGYSGRPLDVLVAVSPDARIAGARLMRQEEPILTLGISADDIAAYVGAFAGYDLTATDLTPEERGAPAPIARATVSTGVIRDAVLRTARTLALGRGLIASGGRIDRVTFEPMDWAGLERLGVFGRALVTLDEARAALAAARVPPPAGDAPFLDLWTTLIDPPTIGRNLLGQLDYSRAMATLGAGDAMLFVASRGLQSHRGTAWRKTGVFDRIEVIQDEQTIALASEGYIRVDDLRAAGAPTFKEVSLFRLPGDRFDPTRPFRVEVTATRPAERGEASMRIVADAALPARFILPPPPEPEPLWKSAWRNRTGAIIGVSAMLGALTLLLFGQEAVVRRPALWRRGRLVFLAVTLVWLGWIAGGQLSVVQVAAFVHALLSGFRWETFLIEPVIFLLWGFVALGLLFWGRGVYCGWLCPFGALQELTNAAARRLGVPQIEVPFVIHERLWVIKYVLFMAILALSFQSMEHALILAEVEPFKTAVSLRFMRAWPFVVFVLALLAAGLFIERFYCRYLCPLGAALAIPAKLKLFDWLGRRPQCGRECRLCEQKCTVGAIDPLGRINPNECVLCLRCQSIMNDPTACTVLKRRAARRGA